MTKKRKNQLPFSGKMQIFHIENKQTEHLGFLVTLTKKDPKNLQKRPKYPKMEWTGHKSSVTVVTQIWIVTEIDFWYQSSDLSCNWISLEYDEIFLLILLIFPFPIFEYSIFFSQECQIKSDLLRIDGYTWLGLDSTGQSTGRANIKSPFRSKTFASFDFHAPQSYISPVL